MQNERKEALAYNNLPYNYGRHGHGESLYRKGIAGAAYTRTPGDNRGMSWRAPVENKKELIEAAEQAGIATDGAYEIVI